jgi:hypothetical protein
MTDDEKIAAVKAVVYSQSPAPCGAIEEIVSQARALDRGNYQGEITPIASQIIDIIYVAHGSPIFPEGTPPVEPPPEPEPEAVVEHHAKHAPKHKDAMG